MSAPGPRGCPAQPTAPCGCCSCEDGFSPPSSWNWFLNKTSQAQSPRVGVGCLLVLCCAWWKNSGHVHFQILSDSARGSVWPSDTGQGSVTPGHHHANTFCRLMPLKTLTLNPI